MINDGYMLLIYDIPNKDKLDHKKYITFRKRIIRNGYIMIQESVYYKYLRNIKSKAIEEKYISSISIDNSNVITLALPKWHFNNIKCICGSFSIVDLSNDFVDY